MLLNLIIMLFYKRLWIDKIHVVKGKIILINMKTILQLFGKIHLS